MARTKWNRKRKQRERQEKEGKPHYDDRDGGTRNKNNGGGIASGCKGGEGYSPLALNNKMMEAYYDLQGLYDTRMVVDVASTSTGDESKSTSSLFVTNVTSEEKQAEKELFHQTVRSILPASFRIAQNVPIEFRDQFIQDVQTHCGETIDIEVDTQYGIEWPSLAATPSNTTTKPLAEANKPASTAASAEQTEGLKELEEDIKSETKEITTATDSTSKDNGNKLLKKTISVKPAREISFIPHAYQLSVDRRTIRRNDKLAQFHEWLKIQTSAGFLTRQETVSMIPPVVLDVQPGHLVLDMCAAPGSKTSQLLEMVVCSHQQNGSKDKETTTDNDAEADSNNDKKNDHGNSEPTGLVVANDNDVKRAYMLVTQLRRLNSPAIFMTSCDAQQFPQLTMPSSPSSSDNNSKQQEEGMFDRVLADVPCTGDGTVRKNPGIWKHWTQNAALAIHPIQLAIALKGARLTKVGGYLCYSTCSLNPIENEAVVSELLKQTNGALTLVDKRTDMKGIQARPGWNIWTVCSNIKKESFKGKNSPKMIAKRKEWAAKRSRQASADADAKAKDGASAENTDAVDGKTNDGAATTTTNNDTTTTQTTDHEQSDKTNNGGTATEETKENQYHNWDTTQLKQTAKNAGLILYDTFQDVPVESQRRIRESCFPPSEKEASQYNLDRCMRILPQDMDTGGFFVALFHKSKPIGSAGQGTNSNGTSKKGASSEGQATEDNNDDAAIENEEKVESDMMEMDKSGKEEQSASGNKGNNEGGDETNSHGGGADVKKDNKKKTNKIGGQPAGGVGNSDFVPVSEDLFPALKEFYGLSDEFPVKQIMSRESGSAKVMYFVTNRVTQLIDAGIQDRCTVINSGLKVFERNSKECQIEYRVNQEGIQFIAPYMNDKRKVIADARDFCTCLHQSEKGTAIWLGNFSQDFQTCVTEMDQGSFVVILKGFEHELVTKKMILVMWKCRGASVNCLVSQQDREGIQSKLRALGLLETIELAPSPNKDESPKKDQS